jgi:uncharacterized low-complexity protein
MKKFFLYVFLALAILAAIFTYILYSEGAFDTQEPAKKSELKPFMKCEAGKCGSGKPETAEKSDLKPSMKCEAGQCASGKCGDTQ